MIRPRNVDVRLPFILGFKVKFVCYILEDCCGAEITSINELGQGLSIRTEDYGNRFEMETICSSSMDELKKPLLRKFNQKTFLWYVLFFFKYIHKLNGQQITHQMSMYLKIFATISLYIYIYI